MLLLLFVRLVRRTLLVLFLAPCACSVFSWIHNLLLCALALPSLTKPCYIRKSRNTVNDGGEGKPVLAKCSSSVSLRARRSWRVGFDVPDFFTVDFFPDPFCLFGETTSRTRADVAFAFLARSGDCLLVVGFFVGDFKRGARGGEDEETLGSAST